MLVVRLLPAPLWLKITAAFLLCQMIYLYSGTTFAPMISAMVLPVLLGTESWVYPSPPCALPGSFCCSGFCWNKPVSGKRSRLCRRLPRKPGTGPGAVRAACGGARFSGNESGHPVCHSAAFAGSLYRVFQSRLQGPANPSENRAFDFPVRFGGAFCRWGLTMRLGFPDGGCRYSGGMYAGSCTRVRPSFCRLPAR